VKHDIKSIAFPAISTGVYRFPLERAAQIAIGESVGFLKENESIEEIVFVCFSEEILDTYQNVMSIIDSAGKEG